MYLNLHNLDMEETNVKKKYAFLLIQFYVDSRRFECTSRYLN